MYVCIDFTVNNEKFHEIYNRILTISIYIHVQVDR